jgi:predicted TIM-barrel fold metal-dependent hydrolase
MGFLDAHVHVWTDDTAHYPLGAGYKAEDMKPKRFTAWSASISSKCPFTASITNTCST